MATAKKTAKPKPAPLPCPAEVLDVFAALKNKSAQQLFHPDPAKRIAAVWALKEKFFYYEDRARLLIAAALVEPEPAVRVAMLAVIADTAGYIAWQQVVQLRDNAQRFADDPLAARASLAQCFLAARVPLAPSDLRWIESVLDEPTTLDERVYQTLAQLVARAVRHDVDRPGAQALYARMLRDPRAQRGACWEIAALGALAHPMIPALIAIIEGREPAFYEAWKALVRLGPSAHDLAALAALERAKQHEPSYAWLIDLGMGLIDRATLPARIEAHRESIEKPREYGVGNELVFEAMSRVPDEARRYAPVVGRDVLTLVAHIPVETMARFVEHAPVELAAAVERDLREANRDGAYILRWWDRLRPQTAAADAREIIANMLASRPRGTLEYAERSLCEACCDLLVRTRHAPEETLATLAAYAARMTAHLTSSVVPPVRAMHALGARDEDFAPIVAAYEKEAAASDKRSASDPAFDPGDSVGLRCRSLARCLLSLSSIEQIRLAAPSFDVLERSRMTVQDELILMLEPFVHEPDVRARIERQLANRNGKIQRLAAAALGLLRA